jgi:hypothetical protein
MRRLAFTATQARGADQIFQELFNTISGRAEELIAYRDAIIHIVVFKHQTFGHWAELSSGTRLATVPAARK